MQTLKTFCLQSDNCFLYAKGSWCQPIWDFAMEL